MKILVCPEEESCVVKMKDKRVAVFRRPEGFNIFFKKFVPIFDGEYQSVIRKIIGDNEIVQHELLLSSEAAFALYEALKQTITIQDIPKEFLNV